jgi:hypothetical protein
MGVLSWLPPAHFPLRLRLLRRRPPAGSSAAPSPEAILNSRTAAHGPAVRFMAGELVLGRERLGSGSKVEGFRVELRRRRGGWSSRPGHKRRLCNTLTKQDSLLIRPTPPRSTRLFFGAEPPLSLHCVDSCFVIPLPTRNMIDAFTLGANISLYSTGLGAALRRGVQKRRQWRPSVHRQTDHDENGYYSDQSAHNLNCSTIVTSPIS